MEGCVSWEGSAVSETAEVLGLSEPSEVFGVSAEVWEGTVLLSAEVSLVVLSAETLDVSEALEVLSELDDEPQPANRAVLNRQVVLFMVVTPF